jgi:hypothetical protein
MPSPPPPGGVVTVDVPLRPDELVGAWRPDSRRLMLPAREPLRLQQRVAARITAVGRGAAATITGRVVSASRHGDVYRIEVVPDEARLRAVERLLSIARGAAVEYQPRAPRFLAAMPAVVYGAGGPTYMTTFSVSERGCGLSWSGPVPEVGVGVDVRLGAGNRAAAFQSVVCWTARSGRTATVGVRFLAGAKNAWAMMLGDVKRSGAPLA